MSHLATKLNNVNVNVNMAKPHAGRPGRPESFSVCEIAVLGHIRRMRHRTTGRISAMTAMGAFLLLLTASAPRAQGSAGPGLFEAGAYSFSDELGGFHITSATGKGTKDDPIVITQELEASSPVKIVIR